ncbi:MAG: serine hydrolase domain-containing protein [Eubacteriales bacterium]|nr:serine hydrolase domain-containing protein [Eubacteriales bacterium]
MEVLELFEKANNMLNTYRKEGFFKDAVVSVFSNKENLFVNSFGDVNADTLFDAASLTKICTTTLILIFIDKNKLKLDSLAQDFLPELKNIDDSRIPNINIYKLLTHTSLLPAWYPFYTGNVDFYHTLKTALKQEQPKGMLYSDLNFMLLGKILEKIAQKPLETILLEELTIPFSLGDICYLPKNSNIAYSSYGNLHEEDMVKDMGLRFYNWRPHEPIKGEVNDGNAHYFFKGVAGHAGVFANVNAYENLCKLYLNTQNPLFINATKPQVSTRCLGFQADDKYPFGCGHTGFTGTSIYFSREYKIGCCLFTNRLFYPYKNEKPTNEVRRALHEIVFEYAKSIRN